MNDLLKRIKESFLKIWNKLSKIQKIIISVALISFLLFVIILSVLSSKVNYQALYSNLDPKDASLIKTQLDKRGVKYRITGNGSVIEVDAKSKDSIRLDLAGDGVVPQGGSKGWELFNSPKIGQTEFDKEIMKLRATKGELEKTIKSLNQVSYANVSITPGNNSPFIVEKENAKASILIALEPFTNLKEENIKSIILLATSSIENLNREDVEVVDTDGNVLSDRVEFGDFASGITNKKVELQKDMEKKLEKKVSKVLSFLGAGNYKITVAVNLDFDKEYFDSEEFTTPTVGGEQLLEGIARSEQEQEESYKGGEDGAQGVAGTSSNIPGYVGIEDSNSNNEYHKKNKIVNYEMNKKTSTYEKASGKTKRITVSVVLNKKATYFKNNKFDDVERTSIENVVKPAVNFDEKRGDVINVAVKPFDNKSKDILDNVIKKQEKAKTYMIITLVVIVVLVIIGFFIAIILRRLEDKRLREKERRAVEDLIPQFEDIALGGQVSVEDQERKDKEDQIKEMARQKPEEVAGLLRSWMLQD